MSSLCFISFLVHMYEPFYTWESWMHEGPLTTKILFSQASLISKSKRSHKLAQPCLCWRYSNTFLSCRAWCRDQHGVWRLCVSARSHEPCRSSLGSPGSIPEWQYTLVFRCGSCTYEMQDFMMQREFKRKNKNFTGLSVKQGVYSFFIGLLCFKMKGLVIRYFHWQYLQTL